jgi:hypothetical protein
MPSVYHQRKEHTVYDYEMTQSDRPRNLPMQAPPIDRTPAGAAAFAATAGVEPSFDWGQLGQTVLSSLPSVLGAFGI